ncbi:flagellar motor protein MotB [Oscillospiraceae bacterium WX1]
MSKKQNHHQEEEAGEAWLLPYSDLMTLLLAVFIVLFAVSKIDQQKAVAMSESFSQAMMAEGAGSGEGAQAAASPGEASPSADSAAEEAAKEYLGQLEYASLADTKEKLDQIFQSENMSSTISTTIDMRGLVITMNNAILFDSGSADIKADHIDTLKKVAEAVNTLDKYIRIEGHTDNVPVSGSIFPSNWELSTARASRVARLFISECGIQPDRIVAVGYGEYRPVGDNSTPEGQAANRRIDIIILSEKYDNLESQVEP